MVLELLSFDIFLCYIEDMECLKNVFSRLYHSNVLL